MDKVCIYQIGSELRVEKKPVILEWYYGAQLMGRAENGDLYLVDGTSLKKACGGLFSAFLPGKTRDIVITTKDESFAIYCLCDKREIEICVTRGNPTEYHLAMDRFLICMMDGHAKVFDLDQNRWINDSLLGFSLPAGFKSEVKSHFLCIWTRTAFYRVDLLHPPCISTGDVVYKVFLSPAMTPSQNILCATDIFAIAVSEGELTVYDARGKVTFKKKEKGANQLPFKSFGRDSCAFYFGKSLYKFKDGKITESPFDNRLEKKILFLGSSGFFFQGNHIQSLDNYQLSNATPDQDRDVVFSPLNNRLYAYRPGSLLLYSVEKNSTSQGMHKMASWFTSSPGTVMAPFIYQHEGSTFVWVFSDSPRPNVALYGLDAANVGDPLKRHFLQDLYEKPTNQIYWINSLKFVCLSLDQSLFVMSAADGKIEKKLRLPNGNIPSQMRCHHAERFWLSLKDDKAMNTLGFLHVDIRTNRQDFLSNPAKSSSDVQIFSRFNSQELIVYDKVSSESFVIDFPVSHEAPVARVIKKHDKVLCMDQNLKIFSLVPQEEKKVENDPNKVDLPITKEMRDKLGLIYDFFVGQQITIILGTKGFSYENQNGIFVVQIDNARQEFKILRKEDCHHPELTLQKCGTINHDRETILICGNDSFWHYDQSQNLFLRAQSVDGDLKRAKIVSPGHLIQPSQIINEKCHPKMMETILYSFVV